jgi:hypothetical protein
MVALLQVFVHAIDAPADQFRLPAWLSRLLPGSGVGAAQIDDLLFIGRVASDGQRAANEPLPVGLKRTEIAQFFLVEQIRRMRWSG